MIRINRLIQIVFILLYYQTRIIVENIVLENLAFIFHIIWTTHIILQNVFIFLEIEIIITITCFQISLVPAKLTIYCYITVSKISIINCLLGHQIIISQSQIIQQVLNSLYFIIFIFKLVLFLFLLFFLFVRFLCIK